MDLNPIKNLWGKSKKKKIVHEMVPSNKKDLLTAFLESWSHFNEENYFKLVKFMPKRVKAAVKARQLDYMKNIKNNDVYFSYSYQL